MSKLAFFTSVYILLSITSYSQEIETVKVKAIKRSIQNANGLVKADQLLALCSAYYEEGFFGPNDPREKQILDNATKAKQEYLLLKNKKGIANANVYLGFCMMLSRKYKEAINILNTVVTEQVADDNMLGYAYGFLGSIYVEQGIDRIKGIDYLHKAIGLYKKTANKQEESICYTRMAMAYDQLLDFKKAVDCLGNATTLARKVMATKGLDGWSDFMYLTPLNFMINYLNIVGDYEKIKEVRYERMAYLEKRKIRYNTNLELGTLYREQGKFDSATYFLNKELEKQKDNVPALIEVSKTYISKNDYRTALHYLNQQIGIFRSRAGKPGYPKPELNLLEKLLTAAELQKTLGETDTSIKLAKEAFSLLLKNKERYSLIDQYELLSKAYNYTGNADSSLFYFSKYTALRDSLISGQFLYKLKSLEEQASEEKKATQLALLQKDNELKNEQLKQEHLSQQQKEAELALLNNASKLKDQQLKEQALIRQKKETELALLSKEANLKQQELKQETLIKWTVSGGFIFFLLIGGITFRNINLKKNNEKLKREKAEHELRVQKLEVARKKAQFQQEAAELEMQALRAQMNPHFIFNCLSSINWLVMGNHNEAASDYLTRFSRLIRLVLLNSEKKLVSLEEELKMLRLYLDMEKLRFENSFECNIQVRNISDREVFVPPMLLQPFCENAIWHGLLNKEGKGHLDIEIVIEEEDVFCTITDDGIGRQKARELHHRENHKSMGLKITTDRLALMNENNARCYEVEDLVDQYGEAAGTRVMIRIKNIIGKQSALNESNHH